AWLHSNPPPRLSRNSKSSRVRKFTRNSLGWRLADEAHWGEVFERNGTLTITSMGHKSSGKWRIEKDQLCLETGQEPGGGCYEVWLSERNVELRNQNSSVPLEGVLQKPNQGR